MSLSRLFAPIAAVIALSGCGQGSELAIQFPPKSAPEVSSNRKFVTDPVLEELREKCISPDPAKSDEEAALLKDGCARNKELFMKMNPEATNMDYFTAPIQSGTQNYKLRM